METLLAAAIGAVAGIFAGLLGIGGGSIMAPLLLFLFAAQGVDPATATLNALATSIAAILFTGTSSMITHAIHKSVNWRYIYWLIPPAMIGAATSAALAQKMPTVILIVLMASYLAFTAWKIGRSKAVARDAHDVVEMRPPLLVGVGFFAGLFGPTTGTGGGLTVSSTMAQLGQPLIFAIGTSAVVTVAVAVAGTASFAFGVSEVSLPVLAAMAPMCMLCAAIGARISNRMPVRKLQLIFAGLLTLITLRLCYLIVQLLLI